MSVRVAGAADLPELERLWLDFEREVPPPAHVAVNHDAERASHTT